MENRKNHIQVNDETHDRRHDLRVIYKVPFRFNGVRKRERNKNNKGKETRFFFLVRNVLLLNSVAITAFLSDTRAHTQLHFRVVDQ